MPRLTLQLFGPPQIALDGAPISSDRRKAIALLAYLVVTAREHAREALAALLWPDFDRTRALAYLRRTLWEIKEAVGEGWMQSDHDGVRVTPDADAWLDVRDFQRAIATWQQAGSATPCDGALDRAVALYGDHFLAGFSLKDAPAFDDWVFFTGEELKRQLGGALEALATCRLERGETEAAIAHARRWLSLDALNEAAHRLLMQAYEAAGQHSAALRQYQECERILHDELGITPQLETTALFEQIKRKDRESPSPSASASSVLRPASASIQNLPRSPFRFSERGAGSGSKSQIVNPFVGRADQLNAIAALLAKNECRLITLMGPGGIGKTRIAQRALELHASEFEHGAHFAPLTPITDPDEIIPAIADAIGFAFFGLVEHEAQRRQLFSYLADKHMLLALDNFEQLIANAGADVVSALLAAAPRIKAIVTSRERLNLGEEWVIEVPGMRVPTNDDVALDDFSSVKLFVQAAQRARVGFTLTDEDKPHIARICQWLRGLPLGIELAGAWTKMLAPRDISEELLRNPDFLASPLRNADARHASLRAVFETSWRLLTPTEQRIFPRLTVFSFGFTREAALAVAGAGLPALAAFVDKSMLNRVGADRYDLHLAVWQYAAEKLAEHADDEAQTRARHSSFYAGFARAQAKHAHSREERAALAVVATEFENIRTGYHWAIKHRNGRDLMDYTDCLAWFTEVFSRFHDGAALATEAIDALNVDGPLDEAQTAAAALLLAWRGRCRWRVQSVMSSVADLRKALDLATRLPESLRATRAFVYMMVIVSNGLNDFDEAGDLGLEAIRIFRERNDIWGVAQIWPFLGMGDFELTKQRFEETLAMRREIGDERGVGLILTDMGEMAHHQGWFAEAMVYYDEAIQLAHQHGDRFSEALALDYAGYVARQMGDFGRSRSMHERSLALSREIGDQAGIAGSLNNLGILAFDQGDTAEARRLLEQGLAISRRTGPDFMITWSQEWLAEVELAEGNAATAETRAQESLALSSYWTGAHRAMGNVRLAQRRFDQARRHFLEAIRQSHDNNTWQTMHSALGLAHLAEAEGNLAHAAELTAFLLGHRGSDHAVQAKARALRDRLASSLLPDEMAQAEARGQALTIEQVMQAATIAA